MQSMMEIPFLGIFRPGVYCAVAESKKTSLWRGTIMLFLLEQPQHQHLPARGRVSLGI